MTKKKTTEHTVTLRFKTAAAKDEFMGQLSDGWGENLVQLDWSERVDIGKANVVDVTVFVDCRGESLEVLTEEDRKPWKKFYEKSR